LWFSTFFANVLRFLGLVVFSVGVLGVLSERYSDNYWHPPDTPGTRVGRNHLERGRVLGRKPVPKQFWVYL